MDKEKRFLTGTAIGPKRQWTIKSISELGVSYHVTLEWDNKTFACTCPDFQYRNHECKHIKKAKRLIAGEKQRNKLPGVET